MRLRIIGTGGTIAGAAATPDQTIGYRSGVVPIQALIAAVPDIDDLARIDAEQPFSIGSEDMGSAQWLLLARRIRELGASREADAIVITHGTDTMEETAWFLDLVCPARPPVVLTGAMRPATAATADGPANLAFACRAALAPTASGVQVAFHGALHPAHSVAKVHTLDIDAFADRSPAGPGSSGRFADAALPTTLPPVALVHAHVDCGPAVVGWHLARGARGIVIAATGNGTLAAPMREALARARQQACLVVRASRVGNGPVTRDAEADPARRDDTLGFLAAGRLGPLKARVLLQCALMAGLDFARIAAEFDRFSETV